MAVNDPRLPSSRRGIALLVVVLLITLLLAVSAQLAVSSATGAVITARQTQTTQHRLAVDSTIRLLAATLTDDRWIGHRLDRNQEINGEFELEDCQIAWRLCDDGAKFNLLPFTDPRTLENCQKKIEELARLKRLPRPTQELRPIAEPFLKSDQKVKTNTPEELFLTLEQALPDIPAAQLFHWDAPERRDEPTPVWSDVVSCFGDGRLDLRRADPQIVDLVLRDVQTGLTLSSADGPDLDSVLSKLHESIRPAVAARIGYGLNRYALTIYTTLGTDVRRWYVVATLDKGTARVHYRQQVTW